MSDIHIPAVVCLVIEAVCLKYQLMARNKTFRERVLWPAGYLKHADHDRFGIIGIRMQAR